MKKLYASLLVFLISNFLFAQNTQILPNSVRIPNVNGINTVANPVQGMVVYNLQDQNLYYRKSSQWINLTNTIATVSTATSIYYTITNSNSSYNFTGEITSGNHANQTNALTLNYGGASSLTTVGGGGGTAATINYSPISFSKLRNVNTFSYLKALSLGATFPTIEFFYYDSNDLLYFSVKLTNFVFTQIYNSAPDSIGGFGSIDYINLIFQSIGWKDYSVVPNTSATYTLASHTYTTNSY